MSSLGELDEECDTLVPGYVQSSSPSYKFDGGNFVMLVTVFVTFFCCCDETPRQLIKSVSGWAVVVHAFNPSTQEAEAGRSL